jgi:uncharacterized protein YutD
MQTSTYKFYITCLLVFFCASMAKAQFRYRIDEILTERDSLVAKNDYLKNRNSGFFGNKTKRDLKNTIETLEEIIVKDSELVAAVRGESIQKSYRMIDKSNSFENRILELEQENSALKRRMALKENELIGIKERIAELKASKQANHSAILLLIISNAVLAVLWWRNKKTPVNS